MHVITVLRDYLGMTQQELARQANITQAEYAGSMVGPNRVPWCSISAKTVHGGRGNGAQPPCSAINQ